jgi:simple sugar transport system permease protein
MSVGRAYLIAMVVAGALAGLAGTQQVLGTDLPLTDGVAATSGSTPSPSPCSAVGRRWARCSPAALRCAERRRPADAAADPDAAHADHRAAGRHRAVRRRSALVRSIFRFLPKERGVGAVLAKGWNG